MSNMFSMFEPVRWLEIEGKHYGEGLVVAAGPSSILHILNNIINNFTNVVLISLMHKTMNGSHLWQWGSKLGEDA